jgi:hypothetical protein
MAMDVIGYGISSAKIQFVAVASDSGKAGPCSATMITSDASCRASKNTLT